MARKPAGAACLECPLRDAPCVKSELHTSAQLVVCGEAPGHTEVEKGTPFCLAPETLVLMADLTWKPLGEIRVGDTVVAVDENSTRGNGISKHEARNWRIAEVTATHNSVQKVYRVTTPHGCLVGTGDHRVLTFFGTYNKRWRRIEQLRTTESRPSKLIFVVGPWEQNRSYAGGWLGGFFDGEGYVLGSKKMRRKKSGTVGFSQNVGKVRDRATELIHELGFSLRAKEEQRSYTGNIIARDCIAGGRTEAMRFLGVVRPIRLIDDYVKCIANGSMSTCKNMTPSQVLSLEILAGSRTVVDITTTTGTFIANGYIVHNCGPSGKAVEQLLRPYGLNRSDISWTNAVLCRPEREKQLPAARKACFDRLQQELLNGPSVVVATGAFALQSAALLKRRPKIQEWRGSVISVQNSNIPKAVKEWQGHKINRLVLPTVHPAFVMRTPLWAPVIQTDFDRIARVLRNGWLPPEKLEGRRMVLVKDIDELRGLLAQLDDVVAIDVETTGLGATYTELVCLSLSDTLLTLVLPWSVTSAGTGQYWGKRQPLVAQILTAALRERTAITHNGPPFDHIVLKRNGIVVEDWEDTLLAHHAFASHMPKRLSHVATMYLDVPAWKHESHDENLRKLYFYNGRDSLYTALSWEAMQPDLKEDTQIYENDRITAELCRTMQVNGFKFDRKRARMLSRRLKQVEQELTAKAAKIYGKPIDLLSTTQLRKAFFEELGAPAFFYSEKTGEPSLNVDTLRAYTTYDAPELRDLALCVIDLRKARKTRSTYVDAPELDAFSRVHAVWKNFGAVSGRFSCDAPNLMNLIRKANDPTITHCNEGSCEGKKKCKCSCWRCAGVRGMYIAEDDCLLAGYDVSQLEMRIAAYASGDEVMIAACETSDLHAANAEIIFGEAFTKASPAERKKLRDLAKQSGFAVAYLAEAATVHARIIATGEMLTLAQVEKMLSTMRERFDQYYAWQADLFLQTIRLGYVETPIMGRKRHVGHTPKPPEVANAPIQGGAADVMNLKLPKIVKRVNQLSRRAKIIAQVHDAGVFEVPAPMADDVLGICKEEFDRPVRINDRDVVFPLDLKKGVRWSDL